MTETIAPILPQTMAIEPSVCKYCLQNCIESKEKFVTPCSCTNPVCISCLRRHIELKNITICEICRSKYKITPDMGIVVRQINKNVVEYDQNNLYTSYQIYQSNIMDMENGLDRGRYMTNYDIYPRYEIHNNNVPDSTNDASINTCAKNCLCFFCATSIFMSLLFFSLWIMNN